MEKNDFQIYQFTSNAIMVALLGLALRRMPYGFYTLLRVVCFLGFGVTAWMYFNAFREERGARKSVFLILVLAATVLCLTYNPVSPLRMRRRNWQDINAASIVFAVLSAGAAFLVRKPLQTAPDESFYFAPGQIRDDPEAVKWYQKAAKQGHPKAQSYLGCLYSLGRGVKQDYVKAFTWQRKSAEQGYAYAQMLLGGCYHLGHGVKRDDVEAVRWYMKAADQGDDEAQLDLGDRYAYGQGVSQDWAEAVRWYRMSANQGHPLAWHSLGMCYANGNGVPQNFCEAYVWLRLQAIGHDGPTEADEDCGLVAAELTPHDLEEAQARAQMVHGEIEAGRGHLIPPPSSPRQGSALSEAENSVQRPPVNPVELGFLELAWEWNTAAVQAGQDNILPSEADLPALACLLISKERNSFLGVASRGVIEANYNLRKDTRFKICDSLIWELCAACFKREPSKSSAMSSLVFLLGHPNSGLRIWGMELGWIFRDWLPAKRVVPILFKNVANTLGGVDEAAGLAAAFFESEDSFFEAAEAFEPPSKFESQFADRIKEAKQHGAAHYQSPFLQSEARIRKLIEDRCFG